ncbi:hypothetical protein EJB05_30172, partial [Eragrostis curvula]
MDDEPDVHRLRLPDQDAPGLAMARAFGDFFLKDHVLICTPEDITGSHLGRTLQQGGGKDRVNLPHRNLPLR